MKDAHKLWTDGGARGNPGPAGIGVVLKDPEGNVVDEIAAGIGWATNNVAEYQGLIRGLELAIKHGVGKLEIYMDSMLVVQQMRGLFKVKHPSMIPLHAKAKELVGHLDMVRLYAVPRAENAEADALMNQGVDTALATGPVDPPLQDANGPEKLF